MGRVSYQQYVNDLEYLLVRRAGMGHWTTEIERSNEFIGMVWVQRNMEAAIYDRRD